MYAMSLTSKTTISPPTMVCKRHHGSALIAIIAAILLFSVLAATLLPLVSSSRQQTAFHHLADQAYFLAESGYRMALHQYRQAQTMQQKVAALENMDGRRFQLEGVGSFEIRIFSYYFVLTNGAEPGVNSWKAVVAGTLPPELLENAIGQTQRLFIGNQDFEVNLSIEDNNQEITIILEDGEGFATPLPQHTIVYPFVRSNGFDPTTGFLSYENGGGGLFPSTHGRIIVGGRIVNYNYNNRDENRFEGIRDPSASSQDSNLEILSGAPIILTNFSRLHSTGIVGQGALTTHRELIFDGAFPQEPFLWEEVTEETFSETSAIANWETVDGSVAISAADGNRALFFEELSSNGGLATSAAAAGDRFTGYRGLTGGFLSYDVQVKLGFLNSLYPETEGDDSDSDAAPSFAGGLSFRLRTTDDNPSLSLTAFNGYGLSIVLGQTGFQLPGTALEAGPLVVLWQQTGGIDTRTWLAYSAIDFPAGGVALLVRLHEAVLLNFTNGEAAAIQAGERIFGENHGAMGTVLSSPILSTGAWNDGSAAGTLLLNKVTKGSTFQRNETLLVVGRSNSAAKVSNDVTMDKKENIIRIYRADLADYPRIAGNQKLQWPPDDGADEEAHTSPFRLIHWDAINDTINAPSELYAVPSSNTPDSILRTYHPNLISKPLSASPVAELGLHAFGDGAGDIFFDDFGFRLTYPVREAFPSPLQQ
ncbi:hypothetical protein [Desulfatitalea alkaliphila]|uniref:Uncharacterized protein n=1 Tax=Desulfatitalea alkaliphila TaxID=2929485 RepID=A0AA41UL03_9BACT|nr:hypothetical protein [Desulfatitalea alkaliphila]MCJ8501972.1 hypothetical protein [Desulfatitalea alkaliphila]